MSACVDVRDAQVNARGRRDLNGVDLLVRAGEVHGLVGPPGSGAAALVSVLKGQQRLAAGSALICGLDCWSDAVAVQSVLAHTPIEVGLWPQLTAGEIMGFLGRFSGGYSPTRQSELVATFGLDLDRQVGSMTAEELRKVTLVGALSREVQVFLLVDGLHDLSTEGRDALRVVIAEVRSAGACVLLTGNEAAPLADFVDATTHLVSGRVVPTRAAADGHHVAWGA